MPEKIRLPEPLKFISMLNRKKEDPGQFTYTGVKTLDQIQLQLFTYDAGSCTINKKLSVDSIGPFGMDHHIKWLNVYGLSDPEAIAKLCAGQNIHTLVIQDILDVNQRPKFQEYEDFTFLTLNSIIPNDSAFVTDHISFVFSKGFLISFQERQAAFFEHIRYRLNEDKGIIRERGSDYLLYTLLESILDNYFKTLNKINESIEDIVEMDIRKEPSPNTLAIIEDHKKLVQYIKKSILPISEYAKTVERGEARFIEPRHIKYYLEVKDLCLTVIDHCDMLLDALESKANLFFSMQGYRMNQVMKTLTIVATIFIPLTFIVGVYGMNFDHIPELGWRYGYLFVWGVMLISLIGMVVYFRRKRWF